MFITCKRSDQLNKKLATLRTNLTNFRSVSSEQGVVAGKSYYDINFNKKTVPL